MANGMDAAGAHAGAIHAGRGRRASVVPAQRGVNGNHQAQTGV